MKLKKYQISLLASLALHSLLILFSVVLPLHKLPEQSERIEITLADPQTLIEPLKENELPKDMLQVVEQDEKPVNDEKSDKAKYLSAHNQVVEKETVAQNRGEFKNRKENNSVSGDGGSPKLSLKDLQPKLDIARMVQEKAESEKAIEQNLEEEALKAYQEKVQQQAQAPQVRPGTGGADVSQTNDYLKDAEKGMETMLSTREFVYYSFYARIRRQLNQHWGGKVREKVSKIVREGRSIASTDDKITKLLITLDKNGTLVKVQVVSDSGIRDLDEAAIEAFKEAAPFPNPPAGIIDPDGTIKIRWDFILEA
jgi:TonB family protein